MIYLIDGYNFIGAHPTLSIRDSEKVARLTQLLLDHPILDQHHLIVIFDGQTDYDLYGRKERFHQDHLICYYTDPGDTADRVLIQLISSLKNKKKLGLVTNDRDIISHCKHGKIKKYSCQDFVELLDHYSPQQHTPIKPHQDPNVNYWLSQFS